jgi:hypothetical protein
MDKLSNIVVHLILLKLVCCEIWFLGYCTTPRKGAPYQVALSKHPHRVRPLASEVRAQHYREDNDRPEYESQVIGM